MIFYIPNDVSEPWMYTTTVPPVIMSAPEEMTVLELNAVTLTCVAEGDPAPATTWIKEGHSVHSSDRVHLMANGSLVSHGDITVPGQI